MNNDDMILPAIGGLRGKPHKLLQGGKVFASVHLGFSHWADKYCHPSLTLGVEKEWSGGETYTETLLNIVFQRTDMRYAGEYGRECGGFLGNDPSGRKWSTCYAGRVDNTLDKRAHLEVGLGLLNRAYEAVRSDDELRRTLNKKGCDLLELITGLQHIGIPVTVRNARRKKVAQVEEPTLAIAG